MGRLRHHREEVPNANRPNQAQSSHCYAAPTSSRERDLETQQTNRLRRWKVTAAKVSCGSETGNRERVEE